MRKPIHQQKAIFIRRIERTDGTVEERFDVRFRLDGKSIYVGTAKTREEAETGRKRFIATYDPETGQGERMPSNVWVGVPGCSQQFKGASRREDGSFTSDPEEIAALRRMRKEKRAKYFRDYDQKRKKANRNNAPRGCNPKPPPDRKPKSTAPKAPMPAVQIIRLRETIVEELKERTRQLLKRGHGESSDFITARSEDAEMMRKYVKDPRIEVVTASQFVRLRILEER